MPENGSPRVPSELRRYVPCLRWKLGEYQALLRSSPKVLDSIVPLIEVPEIGFDFKTREATKSIDKHLSAFAKQVVDKWGRRNCLVDMRLIDPLERMADGRHPATFVFDDLRSKGALATPTVGLTRDSRLESAIKQIVASDGRGLCLRVSIEEVARRDVASSVDHVLARIGAAVAQCDFILDMAAPNFEPIDGLTGLLEALVAELPHLNDWRSFGLIATSFPSSMTEVEQGLSEVPRNEWRLYKSVAEQFARRGLRVPSFGDYAINHPKVPELDMRLVKPYASLRYTIADSWLIARGQNVRDYGYGQYKGLCRQVVESGFYAGPAFSLGDEYINRCAQGMASTGNLTTWRRVGTNHHLEKVVQDVASFADSLSSL